MPRICPIDAIRINSGQIEKSTVVVDPWGPLPEEVWFGSEGIMDDGRYAIMTRPLPNDAVVIIGRSLLATKFSNRWREASQFSQRKACHLLVRRPLRFVLMESVTLPLFRGNWGFTPTVRDKLDGEVGLFFRESLVAPFFVIYKN